MRRDVPYDPDEKCDKCGKRGAFDFMGDYICPDCYAALPDHDDCQVGTCEVCYPSFQPQK